MATTQISDVIVPKIFAPYVLQRMVATSALFRSGIILPDPQINALAKGANNLYEMPFFGDLTGSGRSGISSDNPDSRSTPAKIGTGQDRARKHYRNKSWSTADLTSAMLALDPAKAIGDQLGDYWAQDSQTTLILQLNGVIASNVASNNGDMLVDVTVRKAGDANAVPGDANKISSDVFLVAKQTMGDAADGLTAIVMHSVLHTRLQKLGLVPNVPGHEADIGWGVYLGKYSVVIDDSCPVEMVAGKPEYTSYLFGRGAVGYGEGNPKVPVALTRDEAAGDGEGIETIHNRIHYIMHPRGIKWNEVNIAAASPSDAEMQEAQQWTRVYDRKRVRFVAIKTNG